MNASGTGNRQVLEKPLEWYCHSKDEAEAQGGAKLQLPPWPSSSLQTAAYGRSQRFGFRLALLSLVCMVRALSSRIRFRSLPDSFTDQSGKLAKTSRPEGWTHAQPCRSKGVARATIHARHADAN